MSARELKRRFAAALGTLALTIVASRADAHATGLSSGEYTVEGSSVVGKLVFARDELTTLVPTLDADADGHLTATEVAAARPLLAKQTLERIEVRTNGSLCAATLTDAALRDQDGLAIEGRWNCPTNTASFDVDLLFLDDVAHGHRHIAHASSASTTHDEVLFRGHRSFSLTPNANVPVSAPKSFFSFVAMGVEHILTGYDHLVFLLGLVVVSARLRSLLAIVTSFTLGHSLSLAAAVLGLWAPSPSFVEPAIALSIAYVGIENLFVKNADKRWRITFPFGLVHGFGFAGALQAIDLPRARIPGALVAFNGGVELGQLAVLAVLLPLLFVIRKKPWFATRAVRVVSGAIAIAGCAWFVARVV